MLLLRRILVIHDHLVREEFLMLTVGAAVEVAVMSLQIPLIC